MNKSSIRASIASHRGNPILRFLAGGAEKYLHAYYNQRNWDVRVNGERLALRAVCEVCSGDVFDVGANTGEWASMAMEVMGSRPLHCFEVAPKTYEQLSVNLVQRPGLRLNNFGLGAETKDIHFYYYEDYPPRSSALVMDDGYQKQQIEGSIVRGDDYVLQKNVSEIAFLKVDVEGMEMDVLRGFSCSLDSGNIKAVQFEHASHHIVSRHLLVDFIQFFEPRGFKVLRILPRLLQQIRYNLEIDETFVGENFLAVHASILGRLRVSA
jgi:FkbM family methyltransferase